MYAVIRSGGKQYRVEEGDRLEVERLGAEADSSVSLTPVLVVDGPRVLATPAQLDGVAVSARVVDPDTRAPKVTGFTYKSKSNQRRRWGHRQRHSLVEITAISAGGRGAAKPEAADKATPAAPAKKAPAKKSPAKKATTAKKAPAKKAPAKKKGTG